MLFVPLAITVEEIWPYAGAAGGLISVIVGAFYANLLTQIKDLREEKKVLEETVRTYTISSQVNPIAINALTEAIKEMGDAIEERIPAPGHIPPATRRARGGD